MGPKQRFRSQAVTYVALFCICLMAASLRLFSVIKYESVIHEFDPYFNYRAAQFLIKEGFYEFWNWFDDKTWYPIARVIGGTIYPGLTVTASIMYWVLHALHIPIHIQEARSTRAFPFPSNALFFSYIFIQASNRFDLNEIPNPSNT